MSEVIKSAQPPVELVNGSKEIGEVFVAIASLFDDIRAKKSITEIGMGNFKKLQEAIEGYDLIDDEFKDLERALPTVAFHSSQIAAKLIK